MSHSITKIEKQNSKQKNLFSKKGQKKRQNQLTIARKLINILSGKIDLVVQDFLNKKIDAHEFYDSQLVLHYKHVEKCEIF